MSNTHEEAREICGVCGPDGCKGHPNRATAEKAIKDAIGENWHWPRLAELLGKIPASNLVICVEEALDARDAKHAKEVEELREAMDVAIRKVYSEMKEHRKSSYLSGLSTGGGTALDAFDACRSAQGKG